MALTHSAHHAGDGVDPMAELNHILYRVDRLTGADWDDHRGAGLEDFTFTLEQIMRRVAYLQARVVATAESEGIWALKGFRTVNAWMKNLTGTTAAGASRLVRLSRAIRDALPGTGTALAEGDISVEHGHVLVREATKTAQLRTQLTDPDAGEELLLRFARTMDAGELSTAVKHWAAMADPEAADRNWREANGKEEFILAPTLEGYHLSGWLSPASGNALDEALTAQMGRKSEDDERPLAQRRAAALVSFAHAWLDSGQLTPNARIRPHLTVHVPFGTLQQLCEATGSAIPPGRSFTPGASRFGTLHAPGGPQELPGRDKASNGQSNTPPHEWVKEWKAGDDHVISTALDYDKLRGHPPATFADGTPLAPSLLARLACDSTLMRVVFGADSTILDAGREQRIFPANQTRAVIARDRHCQFPGCQAPPKFGEIHHTIWWAQHNGKTSTDQGILLCWHHHAHVHEKQISIAWINGAWIFSTDQGTIITTPSGRPRAPANADEGPATSNAGDPPERSELHEWHVPPTLAWPPSDGEPDPGPLTWDKSDPWPGSDPRHRPDF